MGSNRPGKNSVGFFAPLEINSIVGGVVLVSGVAWLVLWYSHRGAMMASQPAPELSPSWGVSFLGWILMVLAMMLPTTIPLLRLFNRIVIQHHNHFILHILLGLGYVVTWSGFGLVFVLGYFWLHQNLALTFQAHSISWMMGPGVLLLAGLYQFSSWKSACLTKCRSPLTFLISHWHGRSAPTEAFRLGIAHGLHCLGCCWLLMVIMTIIGLGHLGMMVALALLMAMEKHLRWGSHLRKPIGVLLLGLGLFWLGSEFPSQWN